VLHLPYLKRRFVLYRPLEVFAWEYNGDSQGHYSDELANHENVPEEMNDVDDRKNNSVTPDTDPNDMAELDDDAIPDPDDAIPGPEPDGEVPNITTTSDTSNGNEINVTADEGADGGDDVIYGCLSEECCQSLKDLFHGNANALALLAFTMLAFIVLGIQQAKHLCLIVETIINETRLDDRDSSSSASSSDDESEEHNAQPTLVLSDVEAADMPGQTPMTARERLEKGTPRKTRSELEKEAQGIKDEFAEAKEHKMEVLEIEKARAQLLTKKKREQKKQQREEKKRTMASKNRRASLQMSDIFLKAPSNGEQEQHVATSQGVLRGQLKRQLSQKLSSDPVPRPVLTEEDFETLERDKANQKQELDRIRDERRQLFEMQKVDLMAEIEEEGEAEMEVIKLLVSQLKVTIVAGEEGQLKRKLKEATTEAEKKLLLEQWEDEKAKVQNILDQEQERQAEGLRRKLEQRRAAKQKSSDSKMASSLSSTTNSRHGAQAPKHPENEVEIEVDISESVERVKAELAKLGVTNKKVSSMMDSDKMRQHETAKRKRAERQQNAHRRQQKADAQSSALETNEHKLNVRIENNKKAESDGSNSGKVIGRRLRTGSIVMLEIAPVRKHQIQPQLHALFKLLHWLIFFHSIFVIPEIAVLLNSHPGGCTGSARRWLLVEVFLGTCYFFTWVWARLQFDGVANKSFDDSDDLDWLTHINLHRTFYIISVLLSLDVFWKIVGIYTCVTSFSCASETEPGTALDLKIMCLVAIIPFLLAFILMSVVIVFCSKQGGWLDHCVWILFQSEEAPLWAPTIASLNARILVHYIPVSFVSVPVLALNWGYECDRPLHGFLCFQIVLASAHWCQFAYCKIAAITKPVDNAHIHMFALQALAWLSFCWNAGGLVMIGYDGASSRCSETAPALWYTSICTEVLFVSWWLFTFHKLSSPQNAQAAASWLRRVLKADNGDFSEDYYLNEDNESMSGRKALHCALRTLAKACMIGWGALFVPQLVTLAVNWNSPCKAPL
jgi:hypothetical protein